MKIMLLEHPRSVAVDRCNDTANTPLSSCLLSGYAAGMLKAAGHSIEIVEGYLDNLTYETIAERVSSMRPDILGVHLVYHWRNDHRLFDFLARMKTERQTSSVTAYGFYATISYAGILRDHPAVDSVIIGEPEQPFAGLADAAAFKNYAPDIAGLALRNGTAIRLREPEPAADLDSIPFPVRTAALARLPEVNLLGSRGCYGKCTFCYIGSFYGGGTPWRGRSPENIAGEIDAIIAERGAKNFYFTDPNFFGPGQIGQDRALRLATLLRDRNIRFGIEGRVNDIHDETIAALVDAGLCQILIGLESGKDQSLKRMNKMTTVAQNENALRILRKNGIEPNVGFIMFEPDSSLSDVRVNLEFLKRNGLLTRLATTANVLYHHQIILAGTQAYRDLKREGRLVLEQPSSYEGTAYFQNPEVAVLADVMRQTTNFLFRRMDGIWSGKMLEPPGMQEIYAAVNRVLLETFEDTLSLLERGLRLDNERSASVVCSAQGKMNALLKEVFQGSAIVERN